MKRNNYCSSAVTLSQIIGNPTNQTALLGQAEVKFTIDTEWAIPWKDSLSYQWQKNGADITPTTHKYYRGATSSTLCISKTVPEHVGEYKCIVSNKHYRKVESQAASLTLGMLCTYSLLILIFNFVHFTDCS